VELSAIDHIGVAVESIDAALANYQDGLGKPLVHRETVVVQPNIRKREY
jgi:catechol 2,3-dioxygenase-like lactoylglutathione lyase family enzyme